MDTPGYLKISIFSEGFVLDAALRQTNEPSYTRRESLRDRLCGKHSSKIPIHSLTQFSLHDEQSWDSAIQMVSLRSNADFSTCYTFSESLEKITVVLIVLWLYNWRMEILSVQMSHRLTRVARAFYFELLEDGSELSHFSIAHVDNLCVLPYPFFCRRTWNWIYLGVAILSCVRSPWRSMTPHGETYLLRLTSNPVYCNLRGCTPFLTCYLLHFVDYLEVDMEILGLEPWKHSSEVTFRDIVWWF